MNTIPIKIAVKDDQGDWNPVFNSIQISLQDEGAGGFLRIHGENCRSDGSKIDLEWSEWDSLVDAVNSVRHIWDPDFNPSKGDVSNP